ncbi:UNVERIFIED_CONTAM: hypothetical protein Slati_3726200 [Sesamum latifolium]|uniref:Reverse transcriptase Ty1/copia-type domain-containing protein n=1 Tax=Sesamum latifolium TaxID=2727402 RepID=A0AAW2U2I3_9LAMI
MDQPDGFTTVGEEQKVYRLQRSIYASSKLSEAGTHVGVMISSKTTMILVYTRRSGSLVAYLVLYVDDILLIGNDVKMLGDIKAWLSTQFS